MKLQYKESTLDENISLLHFFAISDTHQIRSQCSEFKVTPPLDSTNKKKKKKKKREEKNPVRINRK